MTIIISRTWATERSNSLQLLNFQCPFQQLLVFYSFQDLYIANKPFVQSRYDFHRPQREAVPNHGSQVTHCKILWHVWSCALFLLQAGWGRKAQCWSDGTWLLKSQWDRKLFYMFDTMVQIKNSLVGVCVPSARCPLMSWALVQKKRPLTRDVMEKFKQKPGRSKQRWTTWTWVENSRFVTGQSQCATSSASSLRLEKLLKPGSFLQGI